MSYALYRVPKFIRLRQLTLCDNVQCMQADYDRASSASSTYSSAAVVNGDVLADDASCTASAGRACNGYRLQNNIY